MTDESSVACRDCGGPCPHTRGSGHPRWYCDACIKARKAHRQKARRATGHRAPSPQPAVRPQRHCTECSAAIPNTRNNGRKRQCSPACRKAFKASVCYGPLPDRCRLYGVAYDPTLTRGWILNRDGYRCRRCQRRVFTGAGHDRKADNYAEIHHIVWLCNRIAGHTRDNVETLCRACHHLEHWGGKGKDAEQHPLFAAGEGGARL